MRRIVLFVIIICLAFPQILLAQENYVSITEEEAKNIIQITTDCLSCVLAVRYDSDSIISLPSTSVSVYQQSNLPRRIAFFLADPADFVKVMSQGASDTGIVSGLFSVFSKSVKDPLVYSAYSVVSSHGYESNDCLVNGSVNFFFPDNVDIKDIADVFFTRRPTDLTMRIGIDLSFYGNRFKNPVSVSGLFSVGIEEDGKICAKPVNGYNVNGFFYKDSTFVF